MKRRTFLAGTAAIAGLSAMPGRMALAGHINEGTPKYGGTLRVAYASDIRSGSFTLNRQSPSGYETGWVSNNIHSGLVTLGPDYEVVPDLAKSWEILGGGKEYIFHLHKNVKFHDGTDCDAAAIKWNFDDMITRGKKSWVYVYYNQLESTQAVDKHTFKITMQEPAALLPPLSGYFSGVPIGSPTAVKKYGKDWLRHPVGTGAFTYDVNDYRPGELIVLKKNPNYFKPGLPYLDRINIQVIRDPIAGMTALRTGQIDFLQRIQAQHVPIMQRAKGVTLVTAPERMPLICMMNLRKPPFDDVRVRRAVGGFGLNRKEIAQTVFQGRANPLTSILPHGVQDHLDLSEMYPYDPAKAKALLKEAGYDKNNPLAFELLLNNDAPFFADAATMIKSQMEKINVKVKLVMMDKPAWLNRSLREYDFEMTMEDFGALVDINQRSVSFFKGARGNYMGMDSPEIVDLTMKWRRSVDPAERREISHEIQRIFAKDMLWCNITGSPYFQAYRDYVKGYHFMNQIYVYWETTWMDKA